MTPESGVDRTCSLCDQPAVDREWVESEQDDEVREAWFCEGHLDKMERYNRGEDVEWSVTADTGADHSGGGSGA